MQKKYRKLKKWESCFPVPKITATILLCIICSLLVNTSESQTKRIYFTGDKTDETNFNKISKSAPRTTRGAENLPSSYSLKSFAPPVGDQGDHGTCVAWSAGYAARTISFCIQHQITDPQKIKDAAFSPGYLYYYVKTTGDDQCTGGAKIEAALKVLADTGDVPVFENVPDCTSAPDSSNRADAKNYTIKAYSSLNNIFGRINKGEVTAIKRSIAEKNPIIISLKCFTSLFNVGEDGLWKITANDSGTGDHAVCIVGYDDNKAGGAFEVMNSWGDAWGNAGFFWLTYEQVIQYGLYALEMMDREFYSPDAARGLDKPQLKGSVDFMPIKDDGTEAMSIRFLEANVSDSITTYIQDQNFPTAKKFRIRFTVGAPAFVYIFSISPAGKASTLFPYAPDVSAAINSANANIYIPTPFTPVAGSAGGQQLCILYSKTALDVDLLKKQIIHSTPSQEIMKLYGNRLIPAKNINFKKGQVGFAAMATESNIVCVFVRGR